MNLRQKATYKSKVLAALYQSVDLKKLLLDDYTIDEKTRCTKSFKEHVKSHLFLEGTLSECGSFVFFDVVIPDMKANTKEVQIILYAVTHREIIDEPVAIEGDLGVGNRADILAILVEDVLSNKDVAEKFGIGDLTCQQALVYNGKDMYGTQLIFSSVDFK